jgi:hypothetical protein
MPPPAPAPNPNHARNLGSSFGPKSAGRHGISLILYPGEKTIIRTATKRDGTVVSIPVTMGHLCVQGGGGETYAIAAGPKPGEGSSGDGGHSAGFTPPGNYVLGPQEHHTTRNWPASVVPWGAALRFVDNDPTKDVEYQASPHSPWLRATGPNGAVTQSLFLWYSRTPTEKPTPDQIIAASRSYFVDARGNLPATYESNDFGRWAWNLMQGGHRSPYYIPTTPETEHNQVNFLMQSHGCVHIYPSDRDDMIAKGYLKQGTPVRVMKYGESSALPTTGDPWGPKAAH